MKNRKIDIDESIITKVIKKLGYKTATDFFNDIASEHLDISRVIDAYVMMSEKDDDTANTIRSAESVATAVLGQFAAVQAVTVCAV